MSKINIFFIWTLLLGLQIFLACSLNWSLLYFLQVSSVSLLSLGTAQAVLGTFRNFVLVMLPFLFWIPLEVGYLLKYGQPASPHVFSFIAESNLEEVLGYIDLWQLVLFGIYLLLIIGCLLGRGYHWVHRSRYWVALTGALYVGGLACAQTSLDSKVSFEEDPFGEHPGEDSVGADRIWASYPASVVVRFLDYLKQQEVIAQSKKRLENIRPVFAKKFFHDEEVYIVVIGESSRKNHWSLYGYEKQTTPRLQKIGNLIPWQDVVAVSGATRTSVPVLLGRNTVAEVLKGELGASWISEFKAQGFKTFWFSSQMEIGTHDTAIGVYAGLADKMKFINLGYYGVTASYDADLLPLVRNALSDPATKKLIILHTLGSHSPYQNRYPSEYDFFKPSVFGEIESASSQISKQEPLINSYDSSILYTDYVLSSLFAMPELASSYAAVWYVSDHGESFLADGCKTFGHGFTAKYNFQVPAMFWYSERYGAANSQLIEKAKMAAKMPFSTQDFFDTVLYSAGFDVANEGFFSLRAAMSQRLVWPTDKSTNIDFDVYFKDNLCD